MSAYLLRHSAHSREQAKGGDEPSKVQAQVVIPLPVAAPARSDARLAAGALLSSDLLTVLDETGRIECQSPAVPALLGVVTSELEGKLFSDLLHNDDAVVFARAVQQVIRVPQVNLIRMLRIRTCDRTYLQLQSSIRNLLGEPEVGGIVVTSTNVSEDLLARSYLEPMTETEPAVADGFAPGVIGKQSFICELERALGSLAASRDALALLLVSIDGYESADGEIVDQVDLEVLRSAASRLQDAVGADEVVALMGDHELGVLMRTVGDEYSESLLRRIPAFLQRPLQTGRGRVSLRANIRLAETSDHLESLAELVGRAEACRLPQHLPMKPLLNGTRRESAPPAKVLVNAEPATVPAVTETALTLPEEPALQLGDLIAEVLDAGSVCLVDVVPDNGALSRGQLSLRYQPVYDLSTGAIAALQVSTDWTPCGEDGGSSLDVLSSTDMSRNTVAIGRWVLRTAARALESLQRGAGVYELRLMIQLFRRQLDSLDLLNHLHEVLGTSALQPEQLVFEVAESVLADARNSAHELLAGLKAMGAQLSISDFEPGYTSLDYLARLQVDEVTVRCPSSPPIAGEMRDSKNFLHTIVRLANAVDVRVVVERVGNPVQLANVRDSGCRFAQGRLFSESLDFTALQQMVRQTPRFSPVVRNFAI
jgi:EAL domain-containing protein (putative c-di-GMP-specific phosphodiesterase class I)/GGDEF domain-containing protein